MNTNQKEQEMINELLSFFKALSDPNRLKIVALLAQEEMTVEQLSEMLNIKPPTVSHHLSKLAKAGLVKARAESYYNFYKLETRVLEEMSQRLLSKDALPTISLDVNMDAYDQKILKNYYSPEGQLKTIPTQQKKILVILKHIIKDFKYDVHYTEKEVNEILSKHNEDYALLRRELFESGLLHREGGGGVYWRIQKEK
ncbi:MAG: metalloregulator ArsR/SmtB family transcription factor [Anaerolineaceae bacterium]|nr:metalloregulator ArsR/SmtB family transcription factor [Anaerolineaceae bacterium]